MKLFLLLLLIMNFARAGQEGHGGDVSTRVMNSKLAQQKAQLLNSPFLDQYIAGARNELRQYALRLKEDMLNSNIILIATRVASGPLQAIATTNSSIEFQYSNTQVPDSDIRREIKFGYLLMQGLERDLVQTIYQQLEQDYQQRRSGQALLTNFQQKIAQAQDAAPLYFRFIAPPIIAEYNEEVLAALNRHDFQVIPTTQILREEGSGRIMDAVNNGSDQITININAYNALDDQEECGRTKLAIHEVLALSGLEGSNDFTISEQFSDYTCKTKSSKIVKQDVRFVLSSRPYFPPQIYFNLREGRPQNAPPICGRTPETNIRATYHSGRFNREIDISREFTIDTQDICVERLTGTLKVEVELRITDPDTGELLPMPIASNFSAVSYRLLQSESSENSVEQESSYHHSFLYLSQRPDYHELSQVPNFRRRTRLYNQRMNALGLTTKGTFERILQQNDRGIVAEIRPIIDEQIYGTLRDIYTKANYQLHFKIYHENTLVKDYSAQWAPYSDRHWWLIKNYNLTILVGERL